MSPNPCLNSSFFPYYFEIPPWSYYKFPYAILFLYCFNVFHTLNSALQSEEWFTFWTDVLPCMHAHVKQHPHVIDVLHFDDFYLAAAAAKSLQSCPTLCDPIDGSPPGFPFPGILQARTLEWVAISFSSAWNWKVKVKSHSRVWLLATPWTAAYQAPPSGVGCHCLLWISILQPIKKQIWW